MKVTAETSFNKDIKKIAKRIRLMIASSIEQMQEAEKISDLKNCKKLKGATNAFRIRIGDYRLGFVLENNAIVLLRCLHRKEIYTYFPK